LFAIAVTLHQEANARFTGLNCSGKIGKEKN